MSEQDSKFRKRVGGAGIFEQVGCSMIGSYFAVFVSREVKKWQKPSDSIL
ncbi:hypothetical protein JCM8795_10560 [Hydrogenobaculum acidophilum]